MNNITIEEVKDILKCSIDETKNINEAIERTLQHIYLKGYLKGWNDALEKALNEAHTIHSEEGIFQVVQAETLIGLGMP